MPRKWQRLSLTELAVGLGSLMVIAIVALALVSAGCLRQQEIEVWRKQMGNISLLLAEQTRQCMASSYLALDGIAEEVNGAGADTEGEFRKLLATPQTFRMLKKKTQFLPHLDVATVVAANGDVINFTRSFPPPPINLADREVVQALAAGHDGETMITPALRSRGNGRPVFYIGRRIDDRHGNLLGMVLVGTSVDLFTSLYQRLGENLGSGASITLYRSDFTILTRWPWSEKALGQSDSAATRADPGTRQDESGVVYLHPTSMSEGGRRVSGIGALRAVPEYPLRISISVTEDLFLHNWHHMTRGIALISVVFILSLLFGLASS
ncbi:hypothetical protein LPW11_12935 [Geomonas sp. RF6]|uniref:hypothetical protein n=1 Tax=Geomonas sp. RF6 TaxID=2897342 RepID=UPI001E31E53A|nr:hypothetical protein [Geomonas sp. RF6]UFS68803.1 hypothetical protein LPW11_12935 [Geomonas sp. RF6]